MDAIIFRVEGCQRAGLEDIAGQPLLLRQLQWLRALGVERLALETTSGTSSLELSELLQQNQALSHGVIEVVSSRPLGAEAVARRAGLAGSPLLLMLGEDVLGSSDVLRVVAQLETSARVELDPPTSLAELPAAELSLVLAGRPAERSVPGPGWGLRVRSASHALKVTSAALLGVLPSAGPAHAQRIQIHATESEPGVWLGRGVLLEPGATVMAPALIGAGAVVRTEAVVSGGSVVGASAAIERGARVHASRVAAGTIIGENVALDRVVASGSELFDVETGAVLARMDPLLVAPIVRHGRAALTSRVLALALLLFVSPLLPFTLFGLSALRRFATTALAVLRSEATLVGVNDEVLAPGAARSLQEAAARAPRGLFDIERALLPERANVEDRLRARAWYAAAKCFRLDVSLVLRAAGTPSRSSRCETPETDPNGLTSPTIV